MKPLKFIPGVFTKDLTGESGCANCNCPIAWENYDNQGYCWTHPRHLLHDCPNNCLTPQPKKTQTIRSKEAKVGDKFSVWEWKEKGWYCLKTMKQMPLSQNDCGPSHFHAIEPKSEDIKFVYGPSASPYPDPILGEYCTSPIVALPRKLFDIEIINVIPIRMMATGRTKLDRKPINYPAILVIESECDLTSLYGKYDAEYGAYLIDVDKEEQHPFVKSDTPSWTNKQFIDFFLDHDPKIKTEWRKKYIWQWRRIS